MNKDHFVMVFAFFVGALMLMSGVASRPGMLSAFQESLRSGAQVSER